MQSMRFDGPSVSLVQADSVLLTINRKIGAQTSSDDAKLWHVNEKSECWLNDKYNYVAFLWSERIGRISQNSDEVSHYEG